MRKYETQGILFVLAAPSGGGKTSLTQKIIEADSKIGRSISHTTRPMRPLEQDGIHYHFVSSDEFQQMVENNAFLEHAIVFGKHYGTSVESILTRLNQGIDIILTIDWQGARQVSTLFQNVVTIFILPPTYQKLEERLKTRGEDSAEIIASRMKKSHLEIQHCQEFDFVVFNDKFEQCLEDIRAIISAERLKYSQQTWRNKATLDSLMLE